jgi:acyl-coenzyme A thioesterase PaaI-like protein
MITDVDSANAILAEVRDVRHSHCRICGSKNEHGIQLKFFMAENGDVFAEFDCEADYQGYPGIIHGGVIAAMLDSAMSNCLFVRTVNAVTAEFVIRYRSPLKLFHKAVIRARVDKTLRKLHFLSGEVLQDGQVIASATSKYMELPGVAVEETGEAKTKSP